MGHPVYDVEISACLSGQQYIIGTYRDLSCDCRTWNINKAKYILHVVLFVYRVESEVRRTFTSSSSCSTSRNGGERSTNQDRSPASTSSTINQWTTNRYRPYRVRQFFRGKHPLPSARREGKRSTADNKPFMRDLVLLSGPDDRVVPRQGTRPTLNERGHVISGCRFTKSQSVIEVARTILEAFDGKIPPGVDIELLISVHSSLVVPSLAPGQLGIDGAMLQRLYRNKPVYIRPNQQLLDLASHGTTVQQVFNILIFLKHHIYSIG